MLKDNVTIQNQTVKLSNLGSILIAGKTGSGKSFQLHNIITSLSADNNREDLNFVLADPKMIEFDEYKTSPLLLGNKLEDPTNIIEALKLFYAEMQSRKSDVCDLEKLPYIIFIIDEFADVCLADNSAEFKALIQSINTTATSVKMQLIVATQTPSALPNEITKSFDTILEF